MENNPQVSFTWEGQQVPWLNDTDAWTMRELREVELIGGGEFGRLSMTSMRGLIACVSISRATGRRIPAIDAEMTMGHAFAIKEELDACYAEIARQKAEAETAAAEAEGRNVEFTASSTVGAAATDGGEVLSPTSAGSEGELPA